MPINMNYCRFSNTNVAVQECLHLLLEGIDGYQETSTDEKRACINMFRSILNFAVDLDVIEGYDGDHLEYMLLEK